MRVMQGRHRHGRRPSTARILVAAGAGSFLAGVNMATIQVALPTISRHFNASASAASWTLVAYLLVFTVMVLILGRVADLWGQGRTYLAGLSTLMVASLLCGFAPTMEALIALRCLQAVGAAAMHCNIAALVAAAVPRDRLSRALGINFAVGSLGQVAGPGLGGVLASAFGWQSVFWFNVPVGVAGLLLARGTLELAPQPQHRPRFDYLGAALAACLLGGLVIALVEGGLVGWSDPLVRGGTVSFVLATPLFVFVERRSRHPLVDFGLFRDSVRGPAYMSLFFLAASFYGLVAVASLFLQAVRGLSPGETGVRVLTLALIMTAVTPLSGALSAKYSARLVASSGAALVTSSLVGMVFFVTRPGVLPLLLGLAGAGIGMFMAPNTEGILGSVAHNSRALANGARQAVQNTGYTVSTALSLAIVTGPLTDQERRAAYAGNLHDLSAASAAVFTHSFRVALTVAAALGLSATIVSILRGREGSFGGEHQTTSVDTAEMTGATASSRP